MQNNIAMRIQTGLTQGALQTIPLFSHVSIASRNSIPRTLANRWGRVMLGWNGYWADAYLLWAGPLPWCHRKRHVFKWCQEVKWISIWRKGLLSWSEIPYIFFFPALDCDLITWKLHEVSVLNNSNQKSCRFSTLNVGSFIKSSTVACNHHGSFYTSSPLPLVEKSRQTNYQLLPWGRLGILAYLLNSPLFSDIISLFKPLFLLPLPSIYQVNMDWRSFFSILLSSFYDVRWSSVRFLRWWLECNQQWLYISWNSLMEHIYFDFSRVLKVPGFPFPHLKLMDKFGSCGIIIWKIKFVALFLKLCNFGV